MWLSLSFQRHYGLHYSCGKRSHLALTIKKFEKIFVVTNFFIFLIFNISSTNLRNKKILFFNVIELPGTVNENIQKTKDVPFTF